jgi:adenylate cyclase
MVHVREVMRSDPAAAPRLLQLIAAEPDLRRRHQLEGLARLYLSPDSPYFDLYGPARAIRTIPYHEIIGAPGAVRTDLRGTIVFVGVSETLRLEQRDGFHTAFSDERGLDTSGVELAATAAANLIEDRQLRPLSVAGAAGIAIVWGLGLALSCAILPRIAAAAVAVAAVGLWLVWVYTRFATDSSWWPLAVPLLVQTPVALGAALLGSVIQSGRERQRLRRAFSLYVPGEFIDELLAETTAAGSRGHVVSGVCLATDAGQYTTLAERMKPEALAGFMNRYYAAVFAPIRRHGGVISDVVGDAALAIWSAAEPSPHMRAQACAAACAVAEAMDRFNQEAEHPPLPTRLGLHAGPIALGNVGAMDHYEFRAVGDTVNSVTRIEALNKHLGTSVLASSEALEGVEGFVTRRLGTFLLPGKSQSLVLHELLGLRPASDRHADRCGLFAEALASWEEGAWGLARQRFAKVLEHHPHDGPSRFYLRLCGERLQEPSTVAWDPVVRVESK